MTDLDFRLQLLDEVDEFIVNERADVVAGWDVSLGSVWSHCYQAVSESRLVSDRK